MNYMKHLRKSKIIEFAGGVNRDDWLILTLVVHIRLNELKNVLPGHAFFTQRPKFPLKKQTFKSG